MAAMGIYKSYDVRGIFGKEWDGSTAHLIGRHLPGLLDARQLIVGRDARLSSDEVFAALAAGLSEAGCDVHDIGVVDTPAVYFATARYGLDGGIMITASHNPPEYNGLKVSRAQAVPVGYDTGLDLLEKRVAAGSLPAPAASPGRVTRRDIRADYITHLARFRSDLSRLHVVIDCSNGTGSVFLRDALEGTGLRPVLLFDELDGRFPNHAPNPLVEENLAALKARVKTERADVGICFDGDADRVMFVDETGAFISPDLLICLLGTYYFQRHNDRLEGGSAVVTYDVRTSRSVVEQLTSLGARPTMCKVGHSFAKKLLRDTRGIVGGELAGHYYFRENYFCDSGLIAALAIMEVLAVDGRPLSRIISGIRRYAFSGELNFTVPNGPEILRRVRADYPGGKLTELDGIRVDYEDWWFNLRVSNTEPLLRLVLEAATAKALEEKRGELVGRIRRYAGQTA
jgi:phosphomannomutase